MKYNGGDNSELIKARRFIKILTPACVILGLITMVLIAGVILMVREQSRLISEKDRYRVALENHTNGLTPEIAEVFAKKGYDSLLTKKDVGENQIPDHYRGKENSKVIAIEYADYACTHCQQSAADFAKIQEDYSDKVLFIYRNFDLGFANSTITKNAAEAAYLLGGEDKFWEMNKLIYSDKTWIGSAVEEKTAEKKFKDYAKKIGFDSEQFWETVNQADTNGITAKISYDKQAALKKGVQGTPTWIINGKKVSSNPEKLRAELDSVLGK